MYEKSDKDENVVGVKADLKFSENGQLKSSREILKMPYAALIVCLILTIGATYLSYTSALSRDQIRFNNEISNVKEILKSKLASYETLLKATKGFTETVEINKNLDRRQFADFVKSFNLEQDYGGVQGIGYTLKVLNSNREEFTANVRETGISDFKIFPEAVKDEYYPVIYLEPSDSRNKRAIGFDMSSEIERKKALLKAGESGKATASAKVELLKESDKQLGSGFLLYLPVYNIRETPQTTESRKLQLKGYVFSPFRAEEFLSDVMNTVNDEEIGVIIYDNEINSENLLAKSRPQLVDLSSRFQTIEDVDFGGRKWKIVYKSIPSLYDKLSTDFSIPILAIGIILSLLMFLITFLESSSRLRYQMIAENLSRTEKEKALLLRSEQFARKQAEDSVKAKNEFISTVSHELRTPLNAISGWTRILKGQQIGDTTKERAFKTIEKNIQTQSDLIEELLDFSDISTVEKEIELDEIDFSDVFEKSVNRRKMDAEVKHIRFESENLLNGEKVKGNQKNIEKAFDKVLQNAVKFTPQDGKIKATIEKEGEIIKFVVNDSGKGIKQENLAKIFDGFTQEDSSTTRKFGGFGLGLTFSKNVVKHHGGKLNIDSEGENKGTTLTIQIPLDVKL